MSTLNKEKNIDIIKGINPLTIIYHRCMFPVILAQNKSMNMNSYITSYKNII